MLALNKQEICDFEPLVMVIVSDMVIKNRYECKNHNSLLSKRESYLSVAELLIMS